MSQYVAKKALLNIKRECSNRSCGCYTEKGYYIKYANRNVESVLFVCDECFQKKYRSQCTIEDFTDANENPITRRTVEIDHPTLRSVIRFFNRTIRTVKYASICLLIVLTIVVGVISNQYSLRNVEIPTGNNSILVTEVLSERIEKVTERVQYFLTEERSSQ